MAARRAQDNKAIATGGANGLVYSVGLKKAPK